MTKKKKKLITTIIQCIKTKDELLKIKEDKRQEELKKYHLWLNQERNNFCLLTNEQLNQYIGYKLLNIAEQIRGAL